jgi:hypothetical protein
MRGGEEKGQRKRKKSKAERKWNATLMNKYHSIGRGEKITFL